MCSDDLGQDLPRDPMMPGDAPVGSEDSRCRKILPVPDHRSMEVDASVLKDRKSPANNRSPL